MNSNDYTAVSSLMAPPRPDSAIVFHSLPWLLLAGGLRLFGGMELVIWATASDPGVGTAGRVAIAVGGIAVIAIGIRTLVEGVQIDTSGMLVRNIFRSRRLRWDEIEDVAPSKYWFNLSITLRDGRRVPARGYGAVSRAKRERLASVLLAARPGVLS